MISIVLKSAFMWFQLNESLLHLIHATLAIVHKQKVADSRICQLCSV